MSAHRCHRQHAALPRNRVLFYILCQAAAALLLLVSRPASASQVVLLKTEIAPEPFIGALAQHLPEDRFSLAAPAETTEDQVLLAERYLASPDAHVVLVAWLTQNRPEGLLRLQWLSAGAPGTHSLEVEDTPRAAELLATRIHRAYLEALDQLAEQARTPQVTPGTETTPATAPQSLGEPAPSSTLRTYLLGGLAFNYGKTFGNYFLPRFGFTLARQTQRTDLRFGFGARFGTRGQSTTGGYDVRAGERGVYGMLAFAARLGRMDVGSQLELRANEFSVELENENGRSRQARLQLAPFVGLAVGYCLNESLSLRGLFGAQFLLAQEPVTVEEVPLARPEKLRPEVGLHLNYDLGL